MVSRDRGTAYAAAATKFGKTQVADGFHLVQNIHQAIKDALSMEIPHDLFVREGDSWIRMVDSAYEKPETNTSGQDNTDCLVVIKPASLALDDMERRIHLAGLNIIQANKYKKTISSMRMKTPSLTDVNLVESILLIVRHQDLQGFRLKELQGRRFMSVYLTWLLQGVKKSNKHFRE